MTNSADQARIACFAAQINAFQDDFAKHSNYPVNRCFHVKLHVIRDIHDIRFRIANNLPSQA